MPIDGLVGSVELHRVRRRETWSPREAGWAIGRAVAFVVVATVMVIVDEPAARPPLDVVALLVVAYAVAWSVEFETPTGVTVPSALALCPMLVLLPGSWVPLAAVAGGLLADCRADARLRRLVGTVWCTIPVLPPALLVAALDPRPAWSSVPVYAAAWALWVATDAASMYVHQRLVLRNPSAGVANVAAMYGIELPLALVAFPAALESDRFRYAFLLPYGLIALLALLTRERRSRVDAALALSTAYRGTARLLETVIAADDGYTGEHSLGVVELVLAVVDRLGLDEDERRRAEFAAMLHDVGKIRVPKELINKPGPLTAVEFEVVRRHATEGAAMLDAVGGYLAEVGVLVRHHHERYDGGGYPDGLAGDAIPLISRVVCACDAFSAMTTDRPYRAARSVEEAVAELQRESGAQFDPAVVAALCAVVRQEPAARSA